MSATREELPGRRQSDRFRMYHDKFEYQVTYSQYPDGRLAEIFLSAGKPGTAVESLARDAAILVSLCLQFGAPEEIIRHSLTRLENGEPATAPTRALDVLAMSKAWPPAPKVPITPGYHPPAEPEPAA